MKVWKIFLSLLGVVGGSVGTCYFNRRCFAKSPCRWRPSWRGGRRRRWARLSPFGTLEIQELEAVDENKSRIAMDFARVEFDPIRLLTGRPEILRADFKLAMVDLELPPSKPKPVAAKPSPFLFPCGKPRWTWWKGGSGRRPGPGS